LHSRTGFKCLQAFRLAVLGVKPRHASTQLFGVGINTATLYMCQLPIVFVAGCRLDIGVTPITKAGKRALCLLTIGLIQFRSVNLVQPNFHFPPEVLDSQSVPVMDGNNPPGPVIGQHFCRRKAD
jgi:hypothetical protein